MPLVTSSTRFAPVSTEPSLRVRLVSWYFTVGGTLRLANIGLAGALLLSNPGMRPAGGIHLLGVLGALAAALGALWTGWLVAQRRRLGLVVGAASFALPLAAPLVGGSISLGGVVFCLVGLALTVSVWREVSEASERSERERD